QEAKRRHLNIGKDDVKEAEREERNSYPDEIAWRRSLASRGLDPRANRAEIRSRLLARALVIAEAERLSVTDAEAAAFWEANSSSQSTPSPEQTESIRWQLIRRKRESASRELV